MDAFQPVLTSLASQLSLHGLLPRARTVLLRYLELSAAECELRHHNLDSESNIRLLCVCALFIAFRCPDLVVDSQFQLASRAGPADQSDSTSFSITRLLLCSDAKVTEFCDRLAHINQHLCTDLLPPSFLQDIRNLQQSLLAMWGVFKQYQDLFNRLIIPSLADTMRQSTASSNTPNSVLQQAEPLFRFAWHLFLYLKVELSSSPMPLMDQMHVLCCCLAMLLKSTVDADMSECVSRVCLAVRTASPQQAISFTQATQRLMSNRAQVVLARLLQKSDDALDALVQMIKVQSFGALADALSEAYTRVLNQAEQNAMASYLSIQWIDERLFLNEGLGSSRSPKNGPQVLSRHATKDSEEDDEAASRRRLFGDSSKLPAPQTSINTSSTAGPFMSPPTRMLNPSPGMLSPATPPVSRMFADVHWCLACIRNQGLSEINVMTPTKSSSTHVPITTVEHVLALRPKLQQFFDLCSDTQAASVCHSHLIKYTDSIFESLSDEPPVPSASSLLTAFGASPPPAMRTLSSPCSVDEEPQSSSQKARTRHTPSPVQLYLQQLTPNSNSADERLSFQPQNASAQLFYVFLENLLAAEQRRQATPQSIATLLLSERFLKSLVAFVSELVIVSFKLDRLSFPFSIDTLGLSAFDFGKIIESCLRVAPADMPRSMRAHLIDTESDIVSCLAFRPAEPLWPIVNSEAGRAFIAARISPEVLRTQPAPASIHGLPVTPRIGSSFAVPASPSTESRAPAQGDLFGLEIFYRKLLHVCSDKLEKLSASAAHYFYQPSANNSNTTITLPAYVIDATWQLLLHALAVDSEALMCDRHVDTLLLCSLYAVCKLESANQSAADKSASTDKPSTALPVTNSVKFTAIIAAYVAKHKNNADKVVKRIPTATGTTDIIRFYNDVFVRRLKACIFEQIKPMLLDPSAHAAGQSNRTTSVTPTQFLVGMFKSPAAPSSASKSRQQRLSPFSPLPLQALTAMVAPTNNSTAEQSGSPSVVTTDTPSPSIGDKRSADEAETSASKRARSS